MLNKVTSIFFILGMLGRKKNKVKILRKSKILSLQADDQVSCSIFWTTTTVSLKSELGRWVATRAFNVLISSRLINHF